MKCNFLLLYIAFKAGTVHVGYTSPFPFLEPAITQKVITT